MPRSQVDVRTIQAPLRDQYRSSPESAAVVLKIESRSADLSDPLHCAVGPTALPDVSFASGAHAAVGGTGDVACSGDLLLAALAACQETTLRMVAANANIELEDVRVEVEGDWDPRGTLGMGDYPIGLTAIRCHTTVSVKGDGRQDRTDRLVRSAEKYCVVLNTLRQSVPVESEFDIKQR
jgi:uncharacterized OsmC-like protein